MLWRSSREKNTESIHTRQPTVHHTCSELGKERKVSILWETCIGEDMLPHMKDVISGTELNILYWGSWAGYGRRSGREARQPWSSFVLGLQDFPVYMQMQRLGYMYHQSFNNQWIINHSITRIVIIKANSSLDCALTGQFMRPVRQLLLSDFPNSTRTIMSGLKYNWTLKQSQEKRW